MLKLKAACLAGAYLISTLVIIYIADITARHQTTNTLTTIVLIMAFAGAAATQLLGMSCFGNALDGCDQSFLPRFKMMSKIRKFVIIAVFLAFSSILTITMPEKMSYVMPQSIETLFSTILVMAMIVMLFFAATTMSSLMSSSRCRPR